MGWIRNLAVVLVVSGISCQDSDEELSQEKKLCQDKSAGELFRLKAGKDACRDVIQCTAAVRTISYSIKIFCSPSPWEILHLDFLPYNQN